jgi:hypothetical protein
VVVPGVLLFESLVFQMASIPTKWLYCTMKFLDVTGSDNDKSTTDKKKCGVVSPLSVAVLMLVYWGVADDELVTVYGQCRTSHWI